MEFECACIPSVGHQAASTEALLYLAMIRVLIQIRAEFALASLSFPALFRV